MTTTITVVRDGEEVDLICEWHYVPATHGHRDKYGAPEEPDEPAYMELESCKDSQGKDVELEDDELRQAELEAEEQYENERSDDFDEEP